MLEADAKKSRKSVGCKADQKDVEHGSGRHKQPCKNMMLCFKVFNSAEHLVGHVSEEEAQRNYNEQKLLAADRNLKDRHDKGSHQVKDYQRQEHKPVENDSRILMHGVPIRLHVSQNKGRLYPALRFLPCPRSLPGLSYQL